MHIIYKQASKTLEYTLEYTLDVTFKQLNFPNNKLTQEFTQETTLEYTRVSDADVAKAKQVLAQTTKMNNPFYYAAVKKRQRDPFQYRYDKMLNSLRRTYSADRFVSLLKVLSQSTLTERDDWLRGMEDATR
tara:strand:- start:307 stop:702 length:396 start_codon:yes stop_codon:yes gene_type:complete